MSRHICDKGDLNSWSTVEDEQRRRGQVTQKFYSGLAEVLFCCVADQVAELLEGLFLYSNFETASATIGHFLTRW